MLGKIKTLCWFVKRPPYWRHAGVLALRKVLPDKDRPELRAAARAWASERAVSIDDALATIGLLPPDQAAPRLADSVIEVAERRLADVPFALGGPGDLNLIYAVTQLVGAKRIVETGVAYGWSSLAILEGIRGREGAKLASVDMPYPKMNNETAVGAVVPDDLRRDWVLIREPDRRGLIKAIRLLGGKIDLAHYDSDKSWYGRWYAYPIIWEALGPGGILISDDIQDNFAFAEFADAQKAPFSVTESGGKFVGIMMKSRSSS
ncbi:MAG TPA: class I SAM-dependent methyltransferase [Thermohalobaculum sp.]|nr:class I SAM-dependent methyltransferase [Thermohalobaculum sp.]